MKKLVLLVAVLVATLAPANMRLAWAQPEYWEPGDIPSDQAPAPLLSAGELDDLVAPIALYPDPLIAQILPAATFVDQIDAAARYIRQYGSNARVDDMPWDVSVKAVAHYPSVLLMMDQKYDWTASLGQAYIDQPQDLMDAIQRLRAQAEAEGNLYTTAEQQVAYDGDYLTIEPVNDYVYVPVYDPNVVYLQPYDPYYPFITFSTGFVIGAWLNRDCDWHRHRVYYHGWRGRGWVGRNRHHIHDPHGVYTGRHAATVNVNRAVLQHDTRGYRQQLRQNSVVWTSRSATSATRPARPRSGSQIVHRRSVQGGVRSSATGGAVSGPAAATPSPRGKGRTTVQGGTRSSGAGGSVTTVPSRPSAGALQRRGGGTRSTAPSQPSAGAVPRGGTRSSGTGGSVSIVPSAPAPATTVTTPPSMPSNRDLYRGRDLNKNHPASQGAFGGYGSSRATGTYRDRGASSRSSAPVTAPPAVTPRAITPSVPRTVAPSVPRSVTPSVPRSVAPSVPRSVTPSVPRSVAPTAPRSFSAPVTAPRPMTAPAAPRGGGMSSPTFGGPRR